MRVGDKLNRGSDKLIVQYSNVGPELYAVCHIWRVHFYIKSLSKIGFYHSGVLRWWLAAALGAYSSTLDYSLAHSVSGEGPSVSSARVAA